MHGAEVTSRQEKWVYGIHGRGYIGHVRAVRGEFASSIGGKYLLPYTLMSNSDLYHLPFYWIEDTFRSSAINSECRATILQRTSRNTGLITSMNRITI